MVENITNESKSKELIFKTIDLTILEYSRLLVLIDNELEHQKKLLITFENDLDFKSIVIANIKTLEDIKRKFG